MSLFSSLFAQTVKPAPSLSKESVSFDDSCITFAMRDGRHCSVLRSDLEEVRIVTNDQSPFVDDVFWIL